MLSRDASVLMRDEGAAVDEGFRCSIVTVTVENEKIEVSEDDAALAVLCDVCLMCDVV